MGSLTKFYSAALQQDLSARHHLDLSLSRLVDATGVLEANAKTHILVAARFSSVITYSYHGSYKRGMLEGACRVLDLVLC